MNARSASRPAIVQVAAFMVEHDGVPAFGAKFDSCTVPAIAYAE
jgi:hypothetical protein